METIQKKLFIFDTNINKNKINIIKNYNNSAYLVQKGRLKNSLMSIKYKILVEETKDVIIMFGRSALGVQRASTLKRALNKTNINIYVFDWKRPLYERYGKVFFIHKKIQCVNDITNIQMRYFIKKNLLLYTQEETNFKLDVC